MQLPFLNIPIALPGDEDQGNKDKTVIAKMQPISILAYHEGYSWGSFIYLQTGQAFCSTLTVEELEKLITSYWSEVNKVNRKGSNIVRL